MSSHSEQSQLMKLSILPLEFDIQRIVQVTELVEMEAPAITLSCLGVSFSIMNQNLVYLLCLAKGLVNFERISS